MYFDRFPIADLRKDPSQRLAWWRRNLRQEVLELQLSKPQFKTKLGGASADGASELEFTCRSVRGKIEMLIDFCLPLYNYVCGKGNSYIWLNVSRESGSDKTPCRQ